MPEPKIWLPGDDPLPAPPQKPCPNSGHKDEQGNLKGGTLIPDHRVLKDGVLTRSCGMCGEVFEERKV